MLVFVSQNYTRVPFNLKNWEKTGKCEPYELLHVIPPPGNTQQQGKSKTKYQTQNKTKKRVAPEKGSLSQMPETQNGHEPEEQQQLQLEIHECQGNHAQQEGNVGTQSEDQIQSLFYLIPIATLTKTK